MGEAPWRSVPGLGGVGVAVLLAEDQTKRRDSVR